MATAPYSKFRPPWDDTHPLWGDALQYVHVSHGTVGFSTAVQNYTVGGSGCVLQLAYPCKGLGEGGAREGGRTSIARKKFIMDQVHINHMNCHCWISILNFHDIFSALLKL